MERDRVQPQLIFLKFSIVTCPPAQKFGTSKFMETMARLNLVKLHQSASKPHALRNDGYSVTYLYILSASLLFLLHTRIHYAPGKIPKN